MGVLEPADKARWLVTVKLFGGVELPNDLNGMAQVYPSLSVLNAILVAFTLYFEPSHSRTRANGFAYDGISKSAFHFLPPR